MKSNNPLVYIIVIMKDNWKDTIECLQSLQSINYDNFVVVLVDNGSEEGYLNKIIEWSRGEIPLETRFVKHEKDKFPVNLVIYSKEEAERGGMEEKELQIKDLPFYRKLVLIRISENIGFAGGNNVGIKYSIAKGAEYILLLNNDTVVNKELLKEMIKTMNSDDRIGIVGGKIYFYSDPEILQEVGGARFYPFFGIVRPVGRKKLDKGQFSEDFEVDYASGCCTFAKRKMIEEIGFLDEDFFHYWEETDWNIRARKKGWKVICSSRAKVWHKLSSTSGYKSPFSDYYFTRNSLILTKKHYPFFVPIVFIFDFYKIPVRMIKGQWKNLRAVLKGNIDFLRGKKGRTF
ncbi:MAG: glycosyltransferase family 2 protein [Candidatus Aminicenantia bacterium]